MQRVLIAGGTGLVGRHLADSLYREGYLISILSRGKSDKHGNYTYHHWDPANGQLDQEAIAEADHVVNLAGANLGTKRWTRSFKHTIYQSRVASTKLLASAINQAAQPPQSFLSASAINYYGIQRKGLVTEDCGPGSHFLSKVCADWEQEAQKVKRDSTRVIIPRLATVLASEDGAFPKMKAPVALGAGAALGSGKQVTPWIHINDLVNMLKFFIQKVETDGVYNAAAPDSATNETLMRTIAQQLNKPFFLPNVPSLALRLLIGQFAEVLMTDLNLDVTRIQAAGFEFEYPDIQKAIADLIQH